MKWIKRFNESYSESVERYEEVFDRIKDCFRDFEDEGWYWSEYQVVMHPVLDCPMFADDTYKMFSYLPIPQFGYMMKKNNDNFTNIYDPEDRRKFDFTGTIDANGEIKWENVVTSWARNYSSDEYKDFTVSIRRLHDEIDMSFKFSYNNIFGEERIIIQGKI